MKKIINTTNEKISVYIFGKQYSVEPKSFVIVPTPVAEYWRGMLHTFLDIEEHTEVIKKEVIEVVKEEVKEEIKSDVISKVKKVLKK